MIGKTNSAAGGFKVFGGEKTFSSVEYTFTVTGLPFKPKRVILLGSNEGATSNVLIQSRIMSLYFGDDRAIMQASTNTKKWDLYYEAYSSAYATQELSKQRMTISDDGFSVTVAYDANNALYGEASSYIDLKFKGGYIYYVIG